MTACPSQSDRQTDDRILGALSMTAGVMLAFVAPTRLNFPVGLVAFGAVYAGVTLMGLVAPNTHVARQRVWIVVGLGWAALCVICICVFPEHRQPVRGVTSYATAWCALTSLGRHLRWRRGDAAA